MKKISAKLIHHLSKDLSSITPRPCSRFWSSRWFNFFEIFFSQIIKKLFDKVSVNDIQYQDFMLVVLRVKKNSSMSMEEFFVTALSSQRLPQHLFFFFKGFSGP